ncbi:DUF1080 domain-containing protein [Lacihabitans sp. CCS-44]|uniref:3-keto-disaccharide hydrolase n=1 Tax=Lacihabitans sp. CCS-44 TaxID=2487331 RepID=UPI0020CD8C4E|nr:DUF1080 domain-containing protein [Lacihabitans sp. CCS-44]MCP9756123.1 DUF1080 domain-containing protein [Lacihabitans sp. CCS-44]
MKIIICFFLSISVVFAQKKSDWQSLFNGKNLDGWDIKISGHDVNVNHKNTFLVEDKMLRINYKEYTTFGDNYGHLYYKTPYSHYILDYTYRFTGTQTPGGATWNVRNSGVMFHSQSAQSLSYDQDFPVSLEMQLLGGLGSGARHTANLCTPGTHVYMNNKLRMEHCIDSDSKTYDGDKWIKARLIVLGDSMVHQIIEGDTVLSYQNTKVGEGATKNFNWKQWGFSEEAAAFWEKRNGEPLKEGYIALQAESHPIDFKDIKLLNLKGCMDKKAKNYKSYYLEMDRSACKY